MFETRQPVDVLVAAVASGAKRLLDEIGADEYARQWVNDPFPHARLQALLAE